MLCVCVSIALVISRARRMRLIVLSSVACLALPFFFASARFSEKKVEHNMCILIFSTILFETFLIRRRI